MFFSQLLFKSKDQFPDEKGIDPAVYELSSTRLNSGNFFRFHDDNSFTSNTFFQIRSRPQPLPLNLISRENDMELFFPTLFFDNSAENWHSKSSKKAIQLDKIVSMSGRAPVSTKDRIRSLNDKSSFESGLLLALPVRSDISSLNPESANFYPSILPFGGTAIFGMMPPSETGFSALNSGYLAPGLAMGGLAGEIKGFKPLNENSYSNRQRCPVTLASGENLISRNFYQNEIEDNYFPSAISLAISARKPHGVRPIDALNSNLNFNYLENAMVSGARRPISMRGIRALNDNLISRENGFGTRLLAKIRGQDQLL